VEKIKKVTAKKAAVPKRKSRATTSPEKAAV
jgi:hypothetical protein